MATELRITAGERLEVREHTPDVLTVEATYAPHGHRPPMHYHPNQDEHFDVLDGTLRVDVAGVDHDLRAGESIDIPRGTPHRMWNPTGRQGRVRWHTRPPGNTEAWFAALDALQGTRHVDRRGRPKPLAFAALAHAHRDTIRLVVRPAAAERVVVGAVAALTHLSGQAPNASRDAAALCGPLAGVAFVGGVAAGVAISDIPYPRPGASPAAIRSYFRGNAGAARVSVVGQLCSAAALARFTGAVAQLAGSRAGQDRLPAATKAAGAAAVASLATSAALSGTLTVREWSDAKTLALHRRVFLTGGPVHTAAFGALVGCLSIAGRRTEQLPDGLTTAGLLAAAAGLFSPVGLIAKPAVLLIPAGRVSGLIVAGIAGARLSRTEHPQATNPEQRLRDDAAGLSP